MTQEESSRHDEEGYRRRETKALGSKVKWPSVKAVALEIPEEFPRLRKQFQGRSFTQ